MKPLLSKMLILLASLGLLSTAMSVEARSIPKSKKAIVAKKVQKKPATSLRLRAVGSARVVKGGKKAAAKATVATPVARQVRHRPVAPVRMDEARDLVVESASALVIDQSSGAVLY